MAKSTERIDIHIKVKFGYPPNYLDIKEAFDPPESVIFTYGNIIFNPSGNDIPDHLLVHEGTHVGQQGDDPKAWWDKYIVDADFRLAQEVEAYRNQWWKFQQDYKDRNVRVRFLMKIARDLSGATYGNLVSFDEAKRLIEK